MADKPLIFLDTNIVISGLISPYGNEYKVLELCLENKVGLILCEAVVEEVKRVVKLKFPDYLSQVVRFIDNVHCKTVGFPLKDQINPYENFLEDKNDLPILVSAIKAQPDYLITGDKGFLACKNKVTFKIVNSREFLNIISLAH